MADFDPVNEDADQRLDGQLIKLAEQYASCDRRSAEINDERKTIRDNAEKLGVPSKAFQHAILMTKHMAEGERRDYSVGVNRVLKAISDRQNDLFPVEAEKIRKRSERKAAEKAAAEGKTTMSREEQDAKSNANPRSDPDAGGASNVVPLRAEHDDEAPPIEDEQALGEAAFQAMMPETQKLSQSAIAAQKRAEAKFDSLMERAMLNKTYERWYVYGVGQRAPVYEHTSERQAIDEAKRLARERVGVQFVVCKAIAAFEADTTPLIQTVYDPEEIPF